MSFFHLLRQRAFLEVGFRFVENLNNHMRKLFLWDHSIKQTWDVGAGIPHYLAILCLGGVLFAVLLIWKEERQGGRGQRGLEGGVKEGESNPSLSGLLSRSLQQLVWLRLKPAAKNSAQIAIWMQRLKLASPSIRLHIFRKLQLQTVRTWTQAFFRECGYFKCVLSTVSNALSMTLKVL